MTRLLRAAAILLFALNTACGVALQTIVGWREEETRVVQRDHSVSVNAASDEVSIARRGPDGSQTELGRAPLVDQVQFPVMERVSKKTPRWPIFVGIAVDAISYGTPLLVALAEGDDDRNSDRSVPLFAGFTIATIGSDLLALLLWETEDEKMISSEPVGGGLAYYYTAREKNGRPWGEGVARAPKDASITIHPSFVEAPSSEGRIVAVMEVRDGSGVEKTFDSSLLRSISDQLRVSLARHGFRTVDRGQQEQVMRTTLQQLKQESYKNCYDNSCQVELGKALAANYLLRSQATKLGSTCFLVAELIELRTEVAVSAASATGACDPEGFLKIAQQAADQLRSR